MIGVWTVVGVVNTVSEPEKPLPTFVDKNTRLSVHDWPAANANGGVPQLPPGLRLKRVEGLRLVTLMLISLVFTRVTGCGALVEVTVALKAKLAGDRLIAAGVALPVSATFDGLCTVVGLVTTLNEPLNPLPTLGDENTRLMLQLWEGIRVNGGAAQLPPGAIANRVFVASLAL